jgi:hypothetical protein
VLPVGALRETHWKRALEARLASELAGVPQPSQNACPSANGLPQFLQKPAIFASQNFSAQVLLYVLCIVPEAQSTGKHDVFRGCTTKCAPA